MSKGKHGHGWGHGHGHHQKPIFLIGTADMDTLAPETANVGMRHFIAGLEGNDSLTGGTACDRTWGGSGDDTINGDAGNDRLWGGEGNDTVNGGDGDDRAYGGAGDDTINGDAGNDRLEGGSGSDTVHGNLGDDSLRGGEGDDFLFGDEGNDVFRGGSGTDELTGGTGSDVFKFGAISGSDKIMDFTVHGPDPMAPAPDADTIDVRGFGLADFDALLALITDETDGATITWTGADGVAGGTDDVVVLIKGVVLADLSANDFLII